jgi:hypothetical protein
MLIEIVDRVQGYKAFDAGIPAVNMIVRGFKFDPTASIAIGKEGVEFTTPYSTLRIVFKNAYTLPYVARTAVRSEAGRRALDDVLRMFPAVGTRD